MKEEFNPNIEDDGQFKLDLQSGSDVVNSNDNKQHDFIKHLSPDDVLELEKEDPVEYEALMDQIEKRKELEDIERRVAEVEKAETLEITKKREEDLRASIAKAFDNRIADEKAEDIETGSGDIYNRVKYAKIIEEQIKAKEEQRRKWWQSKKRHKN